MPKSYNIPLFSSDLYKLNSKIIFPDVTDENASVLFKVGTEQYNNLVNQGLSMGNDRWIQKSPETNWELLKIVILYKMKKSHISKAEQLLKNLRYACKFRPDIAT